MNDHPFDYSREIPKAMRDQWVAQIQRLPEDQRAYIYGCLESSYRWGILHEYDRRYQSDLDERED